MRFRVLEENIFLFSTSIEFSVYPEFFINVFHCLIEKSVIMLPKFAVSRNSIRVSGPKVLKSIVPVLFN